MRTITISFFVPGLPATAGSKKGFPIRRKNGTLGVVITADCKRSKPWMSTIALEAAKHVEKPLKGPVSLRCEFVLPRPKCHFGSGKNARVLKSSSPIFPINKPDVTKLVRCAEDALRGIVWVDDSQVVLQTNCKTYGEVIGVKLTIAELQGVLF